MNNNHLILDCGSTKCEVVTLNSQNNFESSYEIDGFNPLLVAQISQSVKDHFAQIKQREQNPNSILYCGAGCINQDIKDKVYQGLKSLFPSSNVKILDDLEFIGNILNLSKSIICILGTGSNAGLWDGKSISARTASGGYLFGDEGSGYKLGRSLIINFLRNQFDADTMSFLSKHIDRTSIIHEMNISNKPNSAIASYASLLQQISSPLKDQIITEEFQAFIDVHVNPLKHMTDNIHIFGSVGFFNIHYLKPLLEELNLNIGMVAQRPLDLLKRESDIL